MAFGDIVQSDTYTNDENDTAPITLGDTPVEDNLLLALHFTGDGNSVAPSGFSEAVALTDSGNSDQGAIYYKVAGASESKTITCSSDNADEQMATVIEVEGPFDASPLDKTASTGPGTGSTRSSGTTATTSQNDEFAAVLITHRQKDNPNFSGWTNSFTERSDIATTLAKSSGTATRVLTSTGAYETTATIAGSSAEDSMGGIATFKKESAAAALTVSETDGITAGESTAVNLTIDFNIGMDQEAYQDQGVKVWPK